jgi:non-lysosomal glucosylceramidase
MIYTGSQLREISFPLGGIGTGCIGLSGNGRLIDWEIFNKPNKGGKNSFSHFAIKAETDDRLLDAKVLNADLQPPYTGYYTKDNFRGYGFGPDRETLAGMPHFREVEFSGEFPFADLSFLDESFPGKVSLEAFNPFIPLDDRDSSIPGAFFEIGVKNTTAQKLAYTVSLSLGNPAASKGSFNRYARDGKLHTISLGNADLHPDDLGYGDLSVATDAGDVSFQEYWYRGNWFDSLSVFWQDFAKFGRFENRSYNETSPGKDWAWKQGDMCSLAARIELSPGEAKTVRFMITWNFPNCINYWNPADDQKNGNKSWKNHYASVFENSTRSAVYGFEHWDVLHEQTTRFKDALFSSSLPAEAIDAISANLSILKSPTCLRLADGSFYGFEGVHCECGSCEGSCTHVWNYAYALPFLFPSLERSMRDLDYRYNQRDDGGMAFRLQLPIGRERSKFRPCVDGQFGGVIKAYRDWKISGDSRWLESNWAAIKKSIEFAWKSTNEDGWDADRDGVLEGRQHHTLDMELFGPNSWLTGFYLAALKAGAEMASFFGETETAKEYDGLFRKGSRWIAENLFNGEYFIQKIDLEDRSILDPYHDNTLIGVTTEEAYWNSEAGEIKYQIGEGCIVDQVLAQWHANLCGLGDIFDPVQTKKALRAVYANNFKPSMRAVANPCRNFVLNDESALVICDWPEGKYKPRNPIPYAEEAMCGFEYQSAAHMIQAGMIGEGMDVVRAIRDRYDGERRNPWNEFECGSNYSRSMASYSLLLAFSGFEYDLVKGVIGFDPRKFPEGRFNCFWSLDHGWGVFGSTSGSAEVRVLYGSLALKKLHLPFLGAGRTKRVAVDGRSVRFHEAGGMIVLDEDVTIPAGSAIAVTSD